MVFFIFIQFNKIFYKQNTGYPDQSFCGVWSGSALFVCGPKTGRKAYMGYLQGRIQDFMIGGSNLQRGVRFVNFT